MNFNSLNPPEQIVSILRRIYASEMTNLSGGNISVSDGLGHMWITPAGVDKGNLTAEDIVLVNPQGVTEGKHKPSSEYPFHHAIYKKRPDLKAIVHAHPPGLIAYSIAGKVPELRVNPVAYQMCHPVGYAPYAMTGSEELGKNIALTFAGGFNITMLENHGVVCGGEDLLQAYQRLESLELCARTLINAKSIGDYKVLTESQLERFSRIKPSLNHCFLENNPEFDTQEQREIVKIVQRGCDRQLLFSSGSVVSVRIDRNSFLITPSSFDLCDMQLEDTVLIQGDKFVEGKVPSRNVNFHRDIYSFHPDINSVITSQPPHAMAFAITGIPFVSYTIPECYVMLHDVPTVPYDVFYSQPKELAKQISKKTPVAIIANDCVVTTGSSLLQAFDRLEILEYSARSLLSLPNLGALRPIDENRLREIREKFFKDATN